MRPASVEQRVPGTFRPRRNTNPGASFKLTVEYQAAQRTVMFSATRAILAHRLHEIAVALAQHQPDEEWNSDQRRAHRP